jgi:multisubunit Na+/H+ antiporter MnhF subunit
MDQHETNRAVGLRDRWVNVGGLCAVMAFVMIEAKVLTNRSVFDIIAVVALLGMVGSIGRAAAINRRTRT